MRRIIIVAFVALGLAALRPSGVTADPPRITDLQECIRLGLANDPGLRVDELESAAANARLTEMQGQYVPSVSIQTGYSRLSDVAPGSMTIDLGVPKQVTFPASPLNSTIVKLSVQQPLFTGFRIASSIRQADAVRAAAGSDAARSRSTVRHSVETAFWELAKARALEAASRELEAQMERRLADVKTLLDQGVATSNDVLQGDMRLEDSRIDAANAASGRELARVRLAQLTGVPFSPGIDIPEDLEAAAPPAAPATSTGLDELVSQALAARPEVGGARSRLRAQEAAVDLARAGRYPSVLLTGDYTLASPNPRVFPQSDQFTGTWSVGIMASFDVGRYPQVAAQEEQARNRAAQAGEAARRVSEGVAAEVVRAAIVLNAALQSYASLTNQTARAEENARFVQERFRQGVALAAVNLDAQTLLARARLRERAGLYDCLLARAGLDAAVGE
jgi:outer membrane protein TolC